MSNFTTAISLTPTAAPPLRPPLIPPLTFSCTYSHQAALHMIDFISLSNGAPSGSFRPGDNGNISLPIPAFDALASYVNVGCPAVTIVTSRNGDVTKFNPGNHPSLPLLPVDVSDNAISCLYEYTDSSTWLPTLRAIEFHSTADSTPSGVFTIGLDGPIIALPSPLMAALATTLRRHPQERTRAAIDTDSLGNVRGFRSWIA